MTAAPMRSTSDSATSQTISARRVSRPTAASLRPPSFKGSFRSERPARTAGSTPARMPVRSDATIVNSSTWLSTLISLARGICVASSAPPVVSIASASNRPAAPPANDSISASTISCWKTRARPAPSAARIASSFRRDNVRVKSRLPTLAQAISSTSDTAARRTTNGVRRSPTSTSWSGITVAPQPALSLGYSRSSRVEMAVISALACASVTPGFRRATTWAL